MDGWLVTLFSLYPGGLMITRVQIDGFRALKAVDVPLKPLTVLIGKNDTGKSSFMDAISWLISVHFGRSPLQAGLEKARFHGEPDSPFFTKLGGVSGWSFALFSPSSNRSIEWRRDGDWQPPIEKLNSHLLFRLNVHAISMTSPGQEDSWGPPAPGEGTTAALLDYLLRRDRKRFFGFVDALKTRIPGLVDIEIATPDASSRRLDFLLDAGFRLPADQASTGARLITFILGLVFHPSPPALIMMEEPENGVHPSRFKDVVELLRSIALGHDGVPPAQVILSTHSPYLLDCINPNEDQVLVFSRSEDGSRTARAMELDAVKEFLAEDFKLGEIWSNRGEEGMVKRP